MPPSRPPATRKHRPMRRAWLRVEEAALQDAERMWTVAAKQGRSAITGRYVKPATVRRHPTTTVTETRKK